MCSHALVYFVTARASLFTDHRTSGLQMRAKKRHVRTMRQQTFDNSPHRFQPLLLDLKTVDTRCRGLTQLLDVFLLFAVPFNECLCASRHATGQCYHLATSLLFLWKFMIRTSFGTRRRDSCSVCIRVECVPSILGRET